MKRYLLFAYDAYYPGGGCNDLKDDFDTFEEAVAWMNADVRDMTFTDVRINKHDYYQILDTETGNVTDF